MEGGRRQAWAHQFVSSPMVAATVGRDHGRHPAAEPPLPASSTSPRRISGSQVLAKFTGIIGFIIPLTYVIDLVISNFAVF
jgi:hypothetical protein